MKKILIELDMDTENDFEEIKDDLIQGLLYCKYFEECISIKISEATGKEVSLSKITDK